MLSTCWSPRMGSVLGRFNLYRFEDGTAELGYRVAQHVTGRGVATAAVQEVCRLAAARHGLRTLGGYHPPRNPDSPRRSWPRPVLSRQAQPTRPTLAASPALGISAS